MISWTVSARTGGRVSEYTSDDGHWQLWSQPFTPVWHAYYDNVFIKDFLRVTVARTWVAVEGADFVTRHAAQIGASAPSERR